MKVLVTGSDGYIGVPLTEYLRRRGHEITGLDTGFYNEGWLFGEQPKVCQKVRKDVRQIAETDLSGFDAVVHLAELSNDPLGQLMPAITHEINHRGTVALAQKCKEAGIERFVYSSSCSVYGVGNDDIKSEDSPTNPQTDYARCKVLVERDVSAMADDRFSPTFLRNATAFGAAPRMRFDIVLNNLAGLAWTTGEIKMTSDGTPWRPLVHVEDISQAVACVLEAPREDIHNVVLNVGSNEANYQVRDIAEIVAETIPNCRLTFGKNDGDNRSYRVSFDRIRKVLPDFECRHDARSGARQLCEIFRQIGLTRELFQHRAFTRLKQVSYLLASGQLDEHLCWTADAVSQTLSRFM